MLALTLFGIFFAIALAGVPLLYSILITTTGIIALQGLGHPLETIFLSFIGGVEPFILIAVPLGLLALAGRPRLAELARRAVGLLLVPLGFAAYCAFSWRLSGDPLFAALGHDAFTFNTSPAQVPALTAAAP